MNKITVVILALLLTSSLPAQVLAGDFDGSKPLLCAVIQTFECKSAGECLQGTAEDIDIPQFLKIDFKKKIIRGAGESGEVRTTKIKNLKSVDGRLILQGVQNGRAWSMVITATGKFTLTASDDQAGFVVFGACTPR